jgi:hypothetical protein
MENQMRFVGCVGRAALVSVLIAFFAASAAAQTVPFKGDAIGQDIGVFFEATGIHIVARASGTGTGLGRFVETLDYILSYDLIHFSGSASITSADGSEVFLDFEGAIPGFSDQVFPLPYSGTFILTGGTGRFSGVGGAGTLGGIDYGGGLFSLGFSGYRTVGGGDK